MLLHAGMIKSVYKFVGLLFGISLQREFVFLFYHKEGKALLGKGLANFWFLLVIFFLTFLAIGFANGSLEYLESKMKDPFITWMNILMPYTKAEKSDQIIHELLEDTLAKKRYNYRSVTGYNYFSLNFFDKNRDAIRSVYGRTIEPDHPLLTEIMENNLIRGRPYQDDFEIGLIVTERMLRKLNYPVDDPFVCMAFGDQQDDRRIPIPVIAVVKELPGMTDFVCTPYFYNQREGIKTLDGNPFLPSLYRGVSLLIFEEENKVIEVSEKLREFAQNNVFFKSKNVYVSRPQANTYFNPPCFDVSVTFYDDPSMKIRDSIFIELKKSNFLNGIEYIRFYDYTTKITDVEFQNKFDRISIYFPDLDNIKGFQHYLAENHRIDIDMAEIESRENYNLVSKLTRIISIILMVFSTLSICLFISNLLKNHLEKIKMNIGTFLAFGIDYRALERIYLSIIYYVLIIAMAIGLMVSWIIGSLGSIRFILGILNIKIEEGEDYFSQFSEWTYSLIGIVLIISFLVIKKITNRIFTQTPGDLLYDRV